MHVIAEESGRSTLANLSAGCREEVLREPGGSRDAGDEPDIAMPTVHQNRVDASLTGQRQWRRQGDLITRLDPALHDCTDLRLSEYLSPVVLCTLSATPDYILSLENGQEFKSLKRHLMNSNGMTPADYRAKWGLSHDYPMAAPNYAKSRSEFARSMGLGRKAAATVAEPQPTPAAKRRRRAKAVG